MGEHSTLVGGSGASRYINCLGSTALKKKAPPEVPSEFAQLGTMLHFLIEGALEADSDYDPLAEVGQQIQMDENDKNGDPVVIEVTETHILTKIEPAIKFFDEVLDPGDYWLEEKVSFDGELTGAFGTADVLFHNPEQNRAGLCDWKFGDGVMVHAGNNDQIMFYLCAALKLPWFAELARDIDEFEGWICQPVEGRPFEESYSKAIYTRKELEDFELDLLDAKRLKDEGDETLSIGSHCKFCPAETICPAYRDRGAEALASVPRETLKKPPKKRETEKTEKGDFTPDFDHNELRESFLLAKEVGAWADAVKKRVAHEFDNGRPVAGLKKVVYQSQRAWADEKKAVGVIRRLGFKAADYNEQATLKSVAKIEKLVGKDKLRDDLIRSAPKGHSIVTADDPRPAVGDASDPSSVSKQLADALGKAKEK